MKEEIFETIQLKPINEAKEWVLKQKNLKKLLNKRERHSGKTALVNALLRTNDQYEMAKFIIEHGGNVEVVDDNGFNALLWATIIDNQEEKIKVIKLLLENGVNIKQIGSDGHNVLSLLSLTKSKEEILLEVIKQGAEIDQNESIFHQVYEYIEKAKFKNIDFILENGIFKSEKNREKLRALRLTLLF